MLCFCRFKVANAYRLQTLDPAAFRYFYLQVRYDFVKGDLAYAFRTPTKDATLWNPLAITKIDDSEMEEGSHLFDFALRLSICNMIACFNMRRFLDKALRRC